jgi:hypothetical protein
MSTCPQCNKTVYFAERQMGPDGKDWHKSCLIKYKQNKPREAGTFESYPHQGASASDLCSCGAKQAPGAKFCAQCGKKV